MSPEYIQFLTDNLVSISNTFERYKTLKPFMAVYITVESKPYITFGNTSTFQLSLRTGKYTHQLVIVYNSLLDFTEQTNAAMAS